MKSIEIPEIKAYLVIQMLAALTGILFLLFDDFAGFYFYLYNSKAHIWGFIYLGSSYLGSALILVGVGALAISFYYTFKTLKIKGNADAKLVEKYQIKSMRAGFFTTSLAFVGGFIFAAVNIWEETQSWWFDGGFYGSFLGGLVIVTLGKLILDKIDPGRKKTLFQTLTK